MEFLALYPPQSKIAFEFLNISIKWYGVILALAIFIGVFLSYFLICKKYSKQDGDNFLDFCPWLIVFSIIGARIFYILGDFNFYYNNPDEIIMINHGGLSIWGAIIFGIIYFGLLAKIKKIDFLKFTDCIAPALPLCQAIGRFGNYFNQEAFGRPYNGILKLYVSPQYRPEEFSDINYFHPTFLWEGILNIISFIILFFVFFKFKNTKKGTITLLYLIIYSIIRIIVENIRIDSVCYIFNMPVASIISIFIIIISAIILMFNNK